MRGWTFVKLNYYGGEVWQHADGWRAIQVFNFYRRPIGYSIVDETGAFVGHCKVLP